MVPGASSVHATKTMCHTCGAEEPTPQAILESVLSGQSGGPGMARACMGQGEGGREQQ